MTRSTLLQLLIQQAREHGFAFRKWYVACTGVPWSGPEHAVEWLSRGDRANLLLFSQEFARHFWHGGERITYLVPKQTYKRVLRKAHLRRSSRKNVWLFHLREMAAQHEPLRYIRRYLIVDEILKDVAAGAD